MVSMILDGCKEDHPRTCGENHIMSILAYKGIGSPPHLRGKPSSFTVFCSSSGITPAPAGKTCKVGAYFICAQDHPRTCGENAESPFFTGLSPGSPPHLRGKHKIPIILIYFHRITPAPAGKTLHSHLVLDLSQDHPRTCGENVFSPGKSLNHSGSPPHLRGKQNEYGITAYPRRITPAPAGKTLHSHLVLDLSQDHPRTCGENTKK